MDDFQSAVLETLGKAASQNVEFMKDAERQLKCWETQCGFYSTLLNIAFDQNIDINLRWLSILCAKNGVETHWKDTTIASDEKCTIREKLLACLNEPLNQIALQSAVIISKIAFYDFPQEWSQLFDILLNGMHSTEKLHCLRSLLIGHYVVKTLTSGLFSEALNSFQIIASNFSQLVPQWMRYSKLFLEVVQTDVGESSQLLEITLLSLKILRNIICHRSHPELSAVKDANIFLSHIFQQIGPFLECRIVLLNHDHMLQMCEKYILLLVKVLRNILERHPFNFIQYIQPTLECCTKYCFNQDFQDLVFERLIISFLNLIKEILLKTEYSPQSYDYEHLKHLVVESHKIKMEFFTLPAINVMCEQLLSRYFILSENDLNNWENYPEDFASEEIGESCEVSLHACTEDFFSSLLKEFHHTVRAFVVEMANVTPINSSADIIESLKKLQINAVTGAIEILKKEAVYKAMGLSVPYLNVYINFNKWFHDVLITELKIKQKGYYVIRRRVIWLIGKFCERRVSEELKPLLYEVTLESMSNDENLVVRLAAADTLKSLVRVCNFTSEAELFRPFLEKSMTVLYHLLLSVTECDLKVSVLNVLALVIKCMKTDQPEINSFMQYLHQLWETCGDHNMLRCAIISCYEKLVVSLDVGSEMLQPVLIPIIALATDVTHPSHVYMLECVLDLWWAILQHTSNCSPSILNLAQNILPILEHNKENFEISLNIIEAYIFLSPDFFLKKYGHEIAKVFQSFLPEMETKGIDMILKLVEKALIGFPEDSYVYFQPLMLFVLNLILQRGLSAGVVFDKIGLKSPIWFNRGSPDESNLNFSSPSQWNNKSSRCIDISSKALYLSLLSRVILHNQIHFFNILQEKANESKQDVNAVFGELLDIWLSNMPFLNLSYRQKLIALALIRILTSAAEIVYDRVNKILQAIVDVLKHVSQDDGSVTVDVYFRKKSEGDVFQNLFYTSMHESRMTKTQYMDPAFSVVLQHYFCDQMRAFEQSVGSSKFQALMYPVDAETKQKVQYYLQHGSVSV